MLLFDHVVDQQGAQSILKPFCLLRCSGRTSRWDVRRKTAAPLRVAQPFFDPRSVCCPTSGIWSARRITTNDVTCNCGSALICRRVAGNAAALSFAHASEKDADQQR